MEPNRPFRNPKWRSVSRETIPLSSPGPYLQISGPGLAPNATRPLPRRKHPENRPVGSPAGRICRPPVSVVAESKPDLLGRQGLDSGKTHLSITCSQADYHVCAQQGGVGPRLGCRSARNPPCNNASRNQLPADRKQATKSLIPARGHSPLETWKRFCSSRKARTAQRRGSSRRQSQGRCGAVPSGSYTGSNEEQVGGKDASPSASDIDPCSVVIRSRWPTGPGPSVAGFWLGRFCLAAASKSGGHEGNGEALNTKPHALEKGGDFRKMNGLAFENDFGNRWETSGLFGTFSR